ncbi:hypothetical protein Pr1d_31330 [Bythopirellula goksoeyrii]|uniref:Uncharacterized protein n=1 Tax=Bythopirellula goksoeyrii TaxID=1400387 RepID=A0A5B9QA24_9BACT|nr:hypothetical protein Pr1d_31330 [Bythopirellula goksoeyrii]
MKVWVKVAFCTSLASPLDMNTPQWYSMSVTEAFRRSAPFPDDHLSDVIGVYWIA